MVSNRFSRLIKILSGAVGGAEDEIFLLNGRCERFVHFWVLVIRQFNRHRCFVRASGLSYSTLIALIPLLAVALSITSSLLKNQDEAQFQRAVEKLVASVTPPATIDTNLVNATADALIPGTTNALATNTAPAIADVGTNAILTASAPSVGAIDTNAAEVTVSAQKEIARHIWGFVQKTQSVKLGATGAVLLIFMAVSLLGRIEETFNDIWGVTRGRNWLTQIQLYSTAILLGPLLLVTALGLAGGSQFQSAKDYIVQTPFIGKFVFTLLPLLMLWMAFTFVYQLLPNTRVKFAAALVGGAVAGTLWHLNNIFGFLFISRVVTNLDFYGGLGLVPVFMIGIYLSWVILLFGAEIAYAFENRAVYLQDRLADNVNQRGREFVALRLMTSLGQRFQNGLRPATAFQLSQELGIPSRLTQSILRTLAHQQLVTEVAGSETGFVPARPLEAISAYDILLALRTGTGQELPLREDSQLTGIYGEFARIEQAEREASSNITLLALATRMPRPLTLGESSSARTTVLPPPEEVGHIAPAGTRETVPVATVILQAEPAPAIETHPLTMNADSRPESPLRREVARPDENLGFPL